MCIRNCMAVSNQNGYRSDHTIYFVFGTTTLRKAAIDKTAKADSTLRTSRAVPQPSTNRALCRLTSEVERAPVHSTRYGRPLTFFAHQAYPEDVAFTLATCSGQVQHTRSLNLDMIAVKVEALQQYSVSEWARRRTRHPLGSARRGLNPLAVVFVLL